MASLGLKRAVFGAAETCGFNSVSRLLCKNSPAVLAYHGVVGRDWSGEQLLFGNTVSVPEFEAQLDYVASHFTPVSGADLVDGLTTGKSLPDNAVVITFDDGYKNNATLAAQVLLKKGIPAIFHLSTAYIGGRNVLWPDEVILRVLDWNEPALAPEVEALRLPVPSGHGPRRELARKVRDVCKRISIAQRESFLVYLRSKTPATPTNYNPEAHDFMDWTEAQWLANKGFDIGSHTVTHPILTSCPPEMLAAELVESRTTIERETKRKCAILAYPNGTTDDFSANVMTETDKAGYALAFSVEDRRAGVAPPRFAIPRLGVPGHVPLALFQAKLSGLYSLLGR